MLLLYIYTLSSGYLCKKPRALTWSSVLLPMLAVLSPLNRPSFSPDKHQYRKEVPRLKTNRQTLIRELLVGTAVSNQDDLRRKLAGKGVHVTQATLSRDIRELKLLKGPTGYELPDANTPRDDRSEPDFDDTLPAIAELLSSFGLEVRQAANQLVLLTAKGAAGPVAAGLDDEEYPEALGTVAGDNTVLIVCATEPAATSLRKRLETYLG